MNTNNYSRRSILGLSFGTGLASLLLFTGRAKADQPHMQAALDALRVAQRELALAERDKGGHRVRAEGFVRNAIAEVETGIKFDRTR